MDNTIIINELDSALQETIDVLQSFNEEDVNTIPFAGSWTPAQVAEHLRKSEVRMDKVFSSASRPSNRQPDEKAAGLKEMFLNFDTKMKSPAFIEPENKQYDKTEVATALAEIKGKIIDAVNGCDLTGIPPLPDDNPFKDHTKLELVHFMTYHAQRHNHQLKAMKN